MLRSFFTKKALVQGAILCLTLAAANCSGKTYSTFFQPFDLIFGSQGNSAVNGNLIAATPLTNTRVMLTFSKPVTLASGQNTANYRMTGPNGNLLQILAASRDLNNSHIIFIDTIPQASGSQYTVTVSGITFVDNAALGTATATFTAPNNADQTGPQFSSVSVTGGTASATTLEVFFNEALDQTSAQTNTNYFVRVNTCGGASTGVATAVRDSGNYAKVTLTTSSALTIGTTYVVCGTTGLRDIWGNANTAQIESAQFIYTAPTPRVASAVSTSSTSLLVTFDQAMGTSGLTTVGNPGNYTFSSCGALANNTTGATITALNGNTQVLLTGLTVGTTGTCRVTVNTAVRSALGAALTAQTNFALFSYSSTDTTPPVVVSVAPTATTVPTNLDPTNNIRVTFSEPIDLATVSTTAPFSDFIFSPALNIVSVTCTNTPTPHCDIQTADQTTQSYGLTVSGISDPGGNPLANSTTTFTGDGRPYIVAIYPVDTTTVMVQWSEPIGPRASIDDNTGPDFDYTITNATVSRVDLHPVAPSGPNYSAFVQVTLTAAMTPGDSYTLSYSDTAPTGGEDQTGNNLSTTIPGGSTFTGPGATVTSKPYIVSASSTGTTTVIVNFNEPISNANLDPADFTLGGGGACPSAPTNPIQIAAGVIQLTATAGTGVAGTTCSVQVAADQFFDLLGNGNTATTAPHIEYTYTGTGSADTTAPTIASIVSLSNTQIRVFFSEPMQVGGGNGMEDLSRYSVSPALTLTGVGTCANGSSSCIINTSAQTATNYTLSITQGIQDSNGVATTGTITGTFIGTGGSATAPTLFMATLINSTTVELSFSEAVHLDRAQNTANYTVSGGNTVSAAVRQADATKVRLTITPGAYGSSNSYTVTGNQGGGTCTPAATTPLTDLANNCLGTPNSATFNGSATAPAITDLGATSDLGISSTDNITNPSVFPTPGLVFSGTVAANTTVYLYDDGVIVGTAVSDSSGIYTITLTAAGSTVTNGNNLFTIATVGPTGLVSDQSTPLTVNYDATAPGNPGTAADLVAGSDSGISATDNITNDSTPTLSGTGLTAGDYVYIYDGATLIGAALVDGSGNWTWTLTAGDTTMAGAPADQITYAAAGSALSNGAHTITYRVGDTAGNESAASPVLNLTIDTAAPTLTLPVVLTANSYIELPFAGGGIYGSSSNADPVVIGNLTITLNPGTSGITIAPTVRTTANGALFGGESTIRVYLNVTGVPNGTETVQVVANSNVIFDVAGNAVSFDSGVKNFTAAGIPNITGTPTYTTTGATTGYITVTWDEAPYRATGGTGAGVIETTDFTVTFAQNAGGNASSASITGLQNGAGGALAEGDTTMRILISYNANTSGVETIQVNAASGAIFSGINPYQTSPTTEQAGPFTAADRLAPAAPGTPDLEAASDSGSSNTDNITSDTTPTFTVSCETGATVQLYDGASPTGSSGTCASGTVTLTTAALTAGAHNINAIQTDAATNVSTASPNLSVTIDTGTPAAPGTPDLQAASDTGSSATDNITNDTTPTFDISCETGASVQLYTGATPTGTAATCSAGTVTLTAAALGGGAHNINAIQTDAAGHVSAASGNLAITIDTTADAATGTPNLQAASDTGSSNSDDLTNDTTPTFDISCVNGSSVQLYSDAVATGTPATCAGGTVALTAGALAAGSRSITAVQTDPAGNASVASSGLSITIDTTADGAPGTPDLQAASDSGSSNSDNITNDTTPTFDISCVNGSSVQLYSDAVATGTPATCASGTVTLTSAALAAGSRNITAIQTDAAGNASPASSALAVTIDTGTPAATGTPDLQAASDLGSSSTDNITNDTTPTFDLTCETGATVQLYTDNPVAGTATGSTGTCSAGTVTLTTATLAAGVHNISARQTDAAGHQSVASAALGVTIDTTAFGATGTPDMTAATDSGSSNSDNITNNVTPQFTVSCDNGATVQLYTDNPAAGTATGSTGTCAAGTVTLTAATLAAGAHNIIARQTDPAGNQSVDSSALAVTIDTGTPAATGTPDMTAASDTGSSNSDNNTSNQTPQFTFSCETGATVQLYTDNPVAGTATGTTGTCAGGTVTLTAATLASGAHNITARQTDAAGNQSAASGALAVTIDASTPAATGTPDMTAATDSGSSNSDNITNNQTPQFTVSCETNAIVQLYTDNPVAATATGSTGTCAAGTVTLTAATLASGSHNITARQTDTAGNQGAASGALAVTIDTSTPAATGTPDMTAATDSGSSNSDNYTSNQTPQFTFSCETNAVVQLYTDNPVAGTATGSTGTCTAGTVTLMAATLASGSHNITARQTDAAGNQSAASGALATTIDTTAPAATGTPDMTAATDMGSLNTDNITNNQTPQFTVSCETNAIVQLYTDNPVAATATGSTGTCAAGTVTLTAATLAAGSHNISARQTDPAGNQGVASAALAVSIDTTAPVISATSPATSAGVTSSAANVTFSEDCGTATIQWQSSGGTGHPNGPHTRTLTGSELNAGAHTNIAFGSNPLTGGGIYTVRWDCTDVAGNAATQVTATNVTYSDGPPTITSAVALDTNYNGKIDTYQVTFNKNIQDSTFPGYSANALGTVTANWLVAGYTNVRLIHGTAVTFATDTANDSVIYVRFNENVLDCNASTQTGCDTDAKPDLTTTATPGVTDGVQSLAQVNVGTVTEADGAAPVTVRALSLGPTSLDVTFSEPMTITQTDVAGNYTLTGGLTVSAAARDGANFRIVHLTTTAQTGGTGYTLTVNTTLRDLTNINLITNTNPTTSLPANQAQFNGVDRPVVQSITTINATTLLITINETVTEASAICANQTACAAIYSNAALPVLSAVAANSSGVATPGNSRYYRLTVNAMIEGQAYTTTVLQNTMTSVATSQQMGNTNNSATFNGDGRPAVTISTDTATECPTPTNLPPSVPAFRRIVVQYDQAVGASATTAANYTVSTSAAGGCITGPCTSGLNQTASTVTSMGGNKYAVDWGTVFTQTTGTDNVYRLSVANVQDANGNAVATPTNVNFQCGVEATPPSLINVTVVSATSAAVVVLATFSEPVDNVTANVTTNYRYDTQAYGTNVTSAARQSNQAQVLITFTPGTAIANGGHQLRVINVRDQVTPTGNAIVDNGVSNVQPFLVNAPTGFSGGPVFEDPFADGTPAGQIVRYNNKLLLGWNNGNAMLFEMNNGLTTAQTIAIDVDGTNTTPYTALNNWASTGGATTTDTGSGTITGIDTIAAACGRTSTSTANWKPSLTGSACTAENGVEYLLLGGFNSTGFYKSYFSTTETSDTTTHFTFNHRVHRTNSANTYRSMTMVVFSDWLYVASPHVGFFAPMLTRICINSNGCNDGTARAYWDAVHAGNDGAVGSGAGNGWLPMISKFGTTSSSDTGSSPNSSNGTSTLNNTVSIDTIYEYDNDGTGSNVPQLYMANGGRFGGTIGYGVGTSRINLTNSGTTLGTDGGVIRSRLGRSTATRPPGCGASYTDAPATNSAANCLTNGFENITPTNQAWLDYMSIPLPYRSDGTTDWYDMLPSNRIIPAIKAIPYMRTAPNGDLYMIRNACATEIMQTKCMVAGTSPCLGAGPVAARMNDRFNDNFATAATGRRQTCPPGYEVPQLWVLPQNPVSGGTNRGASDWILVASSTFTPAAHAQGTNTVTPRTDVLPTRTATTLRGNTATCVSGTNRCERNAHLTLLEFVGNYLYIGFDNQDHGANVWRVNMNGATCTGSASCATSGNVPAEGSFQIVNSVLGLDGSSVNQRIFSHVTVNEGGQDWLILVTRDGSNSMKIYRTANNQN